MKKEREDYVWFDIDKIKEIKEQQTYLDCAATTFPKPNCVYEAMDTVNRCLCVNAGRGSYELARMATEGIDALRQELLQVVNATEEKQVIFTPSATMACNMILGGIALSERDRVYVSPFLHNAVMRTLWMQQKKCGCSVEILPTGVNNWEIDLEKTAYVFQDKKPNYVFLSHVCNVTGYRLPIEEIFTLAKEATGGEAKVIIDGAQSFGLVDMDDRKYPYDAIIFAGHKTLHGPFGIAGFLKEKSFLLDPVIAGGTGSDSLNVSMPKELPLALEPGSPNLPAVAGLYAALQYRKQVGIQKLYEKEKYLTKLLVEGLEQIEGVTLYVPQNRERHIGIVSFQLEGYRADEVGMILDEDYHISVRTGYHCAPLVHDKIGSKTMGGTVRASLGWSSTEEDVRKLIKAVEEIS